MFDMVIYPAIGGIVVVVVIVDVTAIEFAKVEMMFDLIDTTTELLDAQDKKENQ